MPKYSVLRFNNYYTTSTIYISAENEDEAFKKYKQGDYSSKDEHESSLQVAEPMGGSEIEIYEVKED